MAAVREYGKKGTIGIGVPQANTTIEAEFRAIAPEGVNVITARLQGSRTDSRARLLDYFTNLDAALDSFDSAPVGAFGFANTGTSYLLGADRDRAAFAEVSKRRGYPVVPATEAILESLAHVGTRKLALVSPYPSWLTEAALKYWPAVGIDIVEVVQIEADTADTRNVYNITSADAMAAAKRLKGRDMGAVLLSGTGMPSLRAIGPLAALFGKPILSSNLCLCFALANRIGLRAAPPWERRDAWEPLLDRL
jgi:maleate isomerase